MRTVRPSPELASALNALAKVPPAPRAAREPGLLFLVQREGVRPQGIVGVFSTEDRALRAALQAARAERDDYYDFACYEVQRDLRLSLSFGHLGEDPILFRLSAKTDPFTRPLWFIERPAPIEIVQNPEGGSDLVVGGRVKGWLSSSPE